MITVLAWIIETVFMMVGAVAVGSWLSDSWVGITLGWIMALALIASGLRR